MDANTIIAIGSILLLAGILISMGIGKLQEKTVNTSQDVTSIQEPHQQRTKQTDEADGPSVSAGSLRVPRLQLDRTKTAVIEVMVYNGWNVAEIRAVLKGENAAIGAEVEAARTRLDIDPPERTLRVRDEAGERVISM